MMFSGRSIPFIRSLLLCILIAISTSACSVFDKSGDANVKFDSSKAGTTDNLSDDMPTPPADAQYTIVCRVFADEKYHVQDSRLARKQLAQTTSMKKWYVVHAEDHSTLYYGFYRCMDPRDPVDGAEGQRAIGDLKAIREMENSQGQRFFSASLLVTIDSPDPSANPAWDITRSPGVWSIEIASANSADRKVRTVDAVREARAQGVEAYYYHGQTASSVCIGSWPDEAVIEEDPRKQNMDPESHPLVTSDPVSPEEQAKLEKMHIKTVTPKVDIVDPTLMAALRKWREHSVNGVTLMRPAVDAVTQQPTTTPERSFLFKIPHREVLDTAANTPDAPSAPAPPARNSDSDAGVGHLKSLGE